MTEKLTRAELAAMRDHAPELVRDFIEASGRDIGVRTTAYRKIAEAAKAERQAIMEVHLLGLVKAGGSPAMRMAELERQNAALKAANETLSHRVTALAAIPAMAVNGD